MRMLIDLKPFEFRPGVNNCHRLVGQYALDNLVTIKQARAALLAQLTLEAIVRENARRNAIRRG